MIGRRTEVSDGQVTMCLMMSQREASAHNLQVSSPESLDTLDSRRFSRHDLGLF